MSAIRISDLTKVYGVKRALDGVDLTVDEGSVFGFLGPNGAGKTTTLRILTGMARPTSGKASILGHDVVRATNEVRAVVGFLPDVPSFYDWMTAEDFLRFVASLFRVSGRVLEERLSVLLELSGLEGVHTRIGGYSRGMKQRLGIAQALINAPRVLMLDEPTSALDPLGRREVLDMISSLAGKTTVFFSTHILGDVERVCDMVAILDLGRVVVESSIDDLRRRGGAHHVTVELESGAEILRDAIAGEPWLSEIDVRGDRLSLTVNDLDLAERALPAAIAAKGLALHALDVGEMSLEDVFVDLVGVNG